MSINLECAKCGKTEELPENLSIQRLRDEGEAFRHVKDKDCTEENLFVRTYSYE